MPTCPSCGKATGRKRRNPIQKIFSRAVFQCHACGATHRVSRSLFRIFSRYVECPRCGTRNLAKRSGRDRIDRMSPNPLRRALLFLGCPLYHCTFCRLQFRDWRGQQPKGGC